MITMLWLAYLSTLPSSKGHFHTRVPGLISRLFGSHHCKNKGLLQLAPMLDPHTSKAAAQPRGCAVYPLAVMYAQLLRHILPETKTGQQESQGHWILFLE